jgi:uncharacterized protein
MWVLQTPEGVSFVTRTSKFVSAAALVSVLIMAFVANGLSGPRNVVLLAIGGGLGFILYHSSFGFTGAWTRLLAERRSAGFRSQLAMLFVAVLLFFPLMGAESLFDVTVRGAVAPAGVSVIVGAFLFGVGMQFGGGCASGTLFTIGGGSGRMLITLLGFIIGSVIATHHIYFWWGLPSLGAVSLPKTLGILPALLLNIVVFAGLYVFATRLEKKRHGRVETIFSSDSNDTAGLSRFIQGPWPLIWGAVGLALLNFSTLLVAGRPWGITSAFALWGAKGALLIGLDVHHWQYWANKGALLENSVFYDRTSLMNFGILAGAFLAAGLRGGFHFTWRYPLSSLARAMIGGLLLGYGARLAFGCNIGALFSGIASGSLHGWLWLAAGFAGNFAGLRLLGFLPRRALA